VVIVVDGYSLDAYFENPEIRCGVRGSYAAQQVFIVNLIIMLTTILFFLMVSVFLSYVIGIWTKFGIQKSISESYYALPKKWNWLFVIFCWGFIFPAMIIGASYWMLAAGAGIVLVGAAAAMHTFPTRFWHLTGAIGGIVASQAAIIFQYDMWWLSVASFALAGLVALLFKKYAMWCVELVAFVAITIVLGISIF
jgi:hypothetical protein